MTLQQLISLPWYDMPLTGWGAIAAGCLAVAGLVTYLSGKRLMRANRFSAESVAISTYGIERKSVTTSFGSDFHVGKSQARLGMGIVLFALVALTGLLRL